MTGRWIRLEVGRQCVDSSTSRADLLAEVLKIPVHHDGILTDCKVTLTLNFVVQNSKKAEKDEGEEEEKPKKSKKAKKGDAEETSKKKGKKAKEVEVVTIEDEEEDEEEEGEE